MARWHSANVLHTGATNRRLWQFDANNFKLEREQTLSNGQPLPEHLVAKNWRSLWRKKLNVAWLPPEKVFLRVLQLPQTEFAETLSMVEFQLEKISPLPVAQIVWSVHVLDSGVAATASAGAETAAQQTVIVTIVARGLVEEFLGKLEQEGFLADRLEVSVLDQLATTRIEQDGAVIYPDAANPNAALVAWWFGGVLRSLGLIQAAQGEQRAADLREQLTQMAWAGELEGWLTSPPRWHLVAEPSSAAEWEAVLNQALDQPVKVIAPQSLSVLAAATARRAVTADANSSLLPQEFSLRYRQQFVDRLWMRGIGAVLGVYVICVLIYFVALQVLSYRTNAVETQVAGMSQSYTNARQARLRFEILKEREELKYAALECWKQAAELLPESATLQSMDFTDGKKFTLRGTAPGDAVNDLIDFNTAMQNAKVDGKPLFAKVEPLDWRKDVTGNNASWNFTCELKQTEAAR